MIAFGGRNGLPQKSLGTHRRVYGAGWGRPSVTGKSKISRKSTQFQSIGWTVAASVSISYLTLPRPSRYSVHRTTILPPPME